MESLDYQPIQVVRTSWQAEAESLACLRQRVFVEEQGVSAADEWDGRDELAVHWLARAPDGQAAGTARLLPDGQIGRMAVLPQYRCQGIASALLRHILLYARHQGLAQLTLHAQLHAVSLYQRHGFELDGEEFLDAGLPHRPMRLVLVDRSAQPNAVTAGAAQADEIAPLPLHCRDSEALRVAALELALSARREILMFSSRLLPDVFDHEDFTGAVAACCLTFHRAEVRLLIRDLEYLASHHHRLMAQQQRLPSRMAVRHLDPSLPAGCAEFMLVDGHGLLLFFERPAGTGQLVRRAPRQGLELRARFLELWNSASPDPNLRKLCL